LAPLCVIPLDTHLVGVGLTNVATHDAVSCCLIPHTSNCRLCHDVGSNVTFTHCSQHRLVASNFLEIYLQTPLYFHMTTGIGLWRNPFVETETGSSFGFSIGFSEIACFTSETETEFANLVKPSPITVSLSKPKKRWRIPQLHAQEFVFF